MRTALLLLAAFSTEASADPRCPVPPGRAALPGGVSVCWSDPEVRVGRVDTIDLLTDPRSYELLRYGNPAAGILLKSHARETRLLMARGELFIELDPLSEPEEAARELDRFLRVAADVWDARHVFLEGARSDPAFWRVRTRGGWHSFERLTPLPDDGEEEAPPAEDSEEPVPLKELSDSELSRRLETIAPVKVDGNKVRIEGRRIGSLVQVGRRESLSTEARDFYDELVNRFQKEPARRIMDGPDWPSRASTCVLYCYDARAAEYVAQLRTEPFDGEWLDLECRFHLYSGEACSRLAR